jgi:thymidylate synthase (FAD)
VNVRLIAITKPNHLLEQDGIKTAEQLIVYAARVSNPSNQTNTETGARLLNYCIRNGHWSVFETVSMTVEITTSRAIAAQILRHRSFTFQEFSQRYAQAMMPERIDLRTQHPTNRQASGVAMHNVQLAEMTLDVVEQAFKVYEHLLANGVSKETARMVLPLCTQTTLYMTGNVRSWIHYLEQRTSEGTQTEHRQIAEAINVIFDEQFPNVAKAIYESHT